MKSIDDTKVINYRNLLLLFMKKENSIIKNITGIDFIVKEDIDEIYELDYGICKELIRFISLINDHYLNPWCHINMNEIDGYNCDECSYGFRHGVCGNYNSTYSNVIKIIQQKKIFETDMSLKLKAVKSITELNDIKKLYNYKTEMLISYEKLKLY